MKLEAPEVWKEHFRLLGEDSLRLLAKVYLREQNARKLSYSRELLAQELWQLVQREEFISESLRRLDPFDIQILFLLYFGVDRVEGLAALLENCSVMKIVLRLLNLQERFFILNRTGLTQFEISPAFIEPLQKYLDIRRFFRTKQIEPGKKPQTPSLFCPELLLAFSLFLYQQRIPLKRKVGKANWARFCSVFPGFTREHFYFLRDFAVRESFVYELPDRKFGFSETQVQAWYRLPHKERFFAMLIKLVGLPPDSFLKVFSVWPDHIVLEEAELLRLIGLLGGGKADCAKVKQALCEWEVVLQTEGPEVCYRLNPRLSEYLKEEEAPVRPVYNMLSGNGELHSDLREPVPILRLLLFSDLQHFRQISLFQIQKRSFQRYFNGEKRGFEEFLSKVSELERNGLQISETVLGQWREWFAESCRFQLFKDSVFVCHPNNNELVCHILEGEILANPQLGVFLLDESRISVWFPKLEQADILISRPFCRKPEEGRPEEREFPSLLPFRAPVQSGALIPLETGTGEELRVWSSTPAEFIEKRNLVLLHYKGPEPLHLNFREARGIDYSAKKNLICSLLQPRNRFALLTIAKGEDLSLKNRVVLPISMEPPRENPVLLAVDIEQEKLCRFSLKEITRVNEVFYSLINIPIAALFPEGDWNRLTEEPGPAG